MKITDEMTIIVNRQKLIKNAKNIQLPYECEKKDYIFHKIYGDLESYGFCSHNTLHARLHGDKLHLSLSSYGGMCGVEFDTDDFFPEKSNTVKCQGDLDDLNLVSDVKNLLKGCVKRVIENE